MALPRRGTAAIEDWLGGDTATRRQRIPRAARIRGTDGLLPISGKRPGAGAYASAGAAIAWRPLQCRRVGELCAPARCPRRASGVHHLVWAAPRVDRPVCGSAPAE